MHPFLDLPAVFVGLGLTLPLLQSESERTPLAPASPDAAAPETERPLVAGGEVDVLPLGAASDDVPLPTAPASSAGSFGDEALAEASGDPYFLSFAAGPHRPAVGERLDAGIAASFAARVPDARPTPETYAFVMFARRITDARLAELEELGARVLGFHPHYTMKVAATPEAIASIAELPFVHWVGRARAWQKVHPMLAERGATARADEWLDVWVSTFEADSGGTPTATVIGSVSAIAPDGVADFDPTGGDLPVAWLSNGWQQRALEQLGVEVLSYHEPIAAFRARIRAADVPRLVEHDFVQFVELELPVTPAHDESMPMIQADRTRASWTGGTSSSVVAGLVDSGYDHSHVDLNHIYAWGWDMTAEGDPWFDGLGHGSHVSGSMLGEGDVSEGYRGAAPGLGWGDAGRLFNVKIFDQNGDWAPGATTAVIMDRVNSDVGSTPRPHVINHSYGSGPGEYVGSEATCRTIDADIHANDQLHVFAAHNYGPGDSTLSVQATAKNVLTVGNVLDYRSDSGGYPGTIWSTSSRGPTGDDRWKPNVVAPGRMITSVDAETGDLYSDGSGTSMAAPHVTAVAAQLCDRYAFLRYRPYTIGALLMATAMTKDDEILDAPSSHPAHHLNNYGAGRVDAYRASGSNSQQATYFWAFTQGTTDYGQVEIEVGAGATRLTVAMWYHEEAASAGAGSALVNDLDMWIDRAPFEGGGASGEYFAHQSPRDNVELRMITLPPAASYRIKVVPDSATSASRVGLCAIVSYGDTSPAPTLSVTAGDTYVQPNEAVELTATVSNSQHVASAIHLTTSLVGPPFGDDPESAIVTLEDGVQSDLVGNMAGGAEVTLGNIAHNRSRDVVWTRRWASEGVKTFGVTMRGDNISNSGASDDVEVIVDGTPPAGPTGLHSDTHDVGEPSCESSVQVGWDAATDALSGLDGYSYAWSASAGTVPNETIDLGPGETDLVAALDDGAWYFHIRPVDRSGNWGAAQHYGPLVVQSPDSHIYCDATPNSTGVPAAIWFQGSLSITANDLVLRTSNLPSNQPCVLFYGPNEVEIPFGNGYRCVGGVLVRLPITNTGAGELVFPVDNTSLPAGGDFSAGETLKFQCWYRDPLGGGAFHNLSNGLSLRFCP